ncbi:MAG TPA: sugar ABC transporter permease [Aggregatilinea sp.]|jgi:multiple sugar transport system permease protein|uniref:carbohydrate ABC transporter permease n=1 Tax=Aggregatilinea sp. TaxID=2806333 RepID=UPI002BE70FB3|nr:sugar ABC transporter permease [Aggregatilinea sp.]HML20243.1 sugar ABC transporter permease [Aggregatilinea sp.]
MQQAALRKLMPYLFLLPGFALFTLFVLYPMAYSLRVSFYDWNIINPTRSEFLGLQNYRDIVQDPIFQRAVRNTLLYALVTVPGQMILGLGVAILLNQKMPGQTFFRTVYYLPVITSWVVVTLLFEYLFNSQAGLINYGLQQVGLIDKPIRWMADENLVMVPINLLGIWKGVGWTAVVMLAGLQGIPTELYEAAAVDGANALRRFRNVTLPLLRPTLVFLVVVLTIGALNVYISGLLITNGGDPLDRTHFVLTLMYQETFDNLEFGRGAAISYLLTSLIFVISLVQIRFLQREVDYA